MIHLELPEVDLIFDDKGHVVDAQPAGPCERGAQQVEEDLTRIRKVTDCVRTYATDFGSQQTSIMVVVDELKKIEEDIGNLQKAFSGIGLVCVREDIRLEEIFWSMFPGNFVFLRRKTSIPTLNIGGFAKLNRFASGTSEHTFWPEPITLLPTLVNSPYFFNFHVQDNGHTLWLDFNSFNDKMSEQALAFILTQSCKLDPRVIYFDHRGAAELWFNKMGASYRKMHRKAAERSFALNPFSLEGDPRNIGFLTAWCSELADAALEERAPIKAALDKLYSTTEPRDLKAFVAILATFSPSLAVRFAPWLEEGEFGGLFAAGTDDFDSGVSWLGIDMEAALSMPQNAVAAFAYLLHRIILSLDGRPTIIVLQHAFPILQQPFFASRLESLLEMIKENNAMMIFPVRYADSVPGSQIAETLLKSCGSQVIVPDDIGLAYNTIFPALLSENEQDLLCSMSRMQGDILIKQGAETVAVRINLDAMPDVSAIFHNDIKTLISAGGPFATVPTKESHG